MKGSFYKKADLHIHTPVSKCYQPDQKHIQAGDIIAEAIKKKLDVIAITDHNDYTFIEEVQKAAKGKGIYVFPGVEITAAGAHIIAIFDLDFPIMKINNLLARVGITDDMRGKKDAIGNDVEKVIKEVATIGGIAIAAHANSSNGLLRHPQGSYKVKIYGMPELRALEFNDQDDINKFTQGRIPQYPAKACVLGSDAHCLENIGQQFCHLKMEDVSLIGLSHALIDHEVRVRFPWDVTETTYPRIKNFTVSQGFFGGQVFNFHPNLNCLVGGKGTGKSTVIELMRYCFDDLSVMEDIRDDTLGKVETLVGEGGKISVKFEEADGTELNVEREVVNVAFLPEDSEMEVTDSSGEEVYLLNKPVFFSQGEIARIATNPIAQLELIDRYLDISEENRQEKQYIEELRTNRSLLIQGKTKYQDLMNEIKDPETGKLATKSEHDRLEKELKNPIFSEFPKWELEEQYSKNISEALKSFQSESESVLDSLDIEAMFPAPLDIASPNYTLFEDLTKIPDELEKFRSAMKDDIEKEVKERQTRLKEAHETWQPMFDIMKEEYEEFLAQLGEESVIKVQRRYRNLKIRLKELEGKEREAKTHKKEITNYQEKRANLLKLLDQARQSRFQKRLQKAKDWETTFARSIKIDIQKCSDKKQYVQDLKDFLKGSYVYEKDINTIVHSIDPEKLVEAALTDQVQWIVDESMVREDIVQKLLEHLKTRDLEELYDLQTVNLPDLPEISYMVEPEKYKPLNQLSVGTKSTVVVSIAMVEGNTPLIIDQPEDSLDTEFIYKEVVKKLRQQKESRQFIFSTHNPNILMAGDADLSYILTATSEKGSVKSSGGIDHLDTNKLIVLHLEGGTEAFQLRARKYIP